MKRVITVIFIISILSVSLFAEEGYYNNCNESYSYGYFIYNEEGLSEEQLSQVIQLKSKYQPKIAELRKKIYLGKTKMNLEMSKKYPNRNLIDNSKILNMQYAKELQKLANEFLAEYNKIKNNK
ncbi:hypothetical protein [Brachyspira alvinipulli]|uniref:hypothetical protein n=1 Tax=Brachyspira alvinipulli TaxID=84379 RepID=UPI0004800B9F|nr:hypothetical protein [Brachyspira alvinipulli]